MPTTATRAFAAPALLVLASLPALAADGVVALKARRVHTVSGPAIENGVVIVRDGKIAAVGAGLPIPDGAFVIEGEDLAPGLVDAGAGYGVSGGANERSSEVTPDFRIADAIDPLDRTLAQVMETGVTAAYVEPGGENVIAGLGAVVKTAGPPASADRVVSDRAGLEVTIGTEPSAGNQTPRGGAPTTFYFRRPTTRMGVIWLLRRSFTDALRAPLGSPMEPAIGAAGRAVLEDALAGAIPIRVTARKSHDILSAYRLADELGWKRIVIEDGVEGYKIAPEIARRKSPVILGPYMFETPRGRRAGLDGAEPIWANATVLDAAGVPLAFQTGDREEAARLRDVATFSVRHGLPHGTALRALTLGGAEILGVSSRIGSIEAGKDADLVLFSGDPLDPRSVVEAVLVGGRVTYRRSESF